MKNAGIMFNEHAKRWELFDACTGEELEAWTVEGVPAAGEELDYRAIEEAANGLGYTIL